MKPTKLDIAQSGNYLSTGTYFTITGKYCKPYIFGGESWQRWNIRHNGVACGYLVFRAHDFVEVGEEFKIIQVSVPTSLGWPFKGDWAIVERVPSTAQPPTRTIRLCSYANCTNHVCIDSNGCLDHQFLDDPKPPIDVKQCANDCKEVVEADIASWSTFCKACRAKITGKEDTYKDGYLVQSPVGADDAIGIIADTYKFPSTPYVFQPLTKESHMNGTVYTSAVVVRNKTVAAGEGVTTGVTRSEVVYSHPKAVIASSVENAKAIVLASAVVAAKGDIDLEDLTVTYEVKLVTAG